MKFHTVIALVSLLALAVNVYAVDLIHVSTVAPDCVHYNNADKCRAQPGCSWCSTSQYQVCVQSEDNCDCVLRSGYDSCIQNPDCHYCNLGAYAGRYCIAKNIQCG